MKLSQFVLALFIGSIILISCGKDNELTPNPIYDPEASGTTNNGGGSGGGSGGGTIISQGLTGNFGGTSMTINECFFEMDSVIILTHIEAKNGDSSQTVNFVINEHITAPKTYTAGDSLTTLSYDFDATDTTTKTNFIGVNGNLTITSVTATEIKGTFSFSSVNIDDFNQVEDVTGGSFTAKKK